MATKTKQKSRFHAFWYGVGSILDIGGHSFIGRRKQRAQEFNERLLSVLEHDLDDDMKAVSHDLDNVLERHVS